MFHSKFIPFIAVILWGSASFALPVVSILKYKKAGETELTPAAVRAIADLKKQGGGTLMYPAGRFVQGPVEITGSAISIQGAGIGRTVIVRNNQRGYAFFANRKQRVFIRDLTLDCDQSPIEGGIYLGGCTASGADRVYCRNADASTFVVENQLFNAGDEKSVSDRNVFRNCQASGQKRYHDAGGKSPFIAGGYARNTRFEQCTVTDCVGDAFDSDNAPGTVFLHCVARNTKGISPYAGFWSEGEQTDSDHRVTWNHCKVVGYRVGFGISERVKATILNGEAENCVNAVKGLHYQYRIQINTFTARHCGKGLEATDTDGVLTFSGPATLTKVKTLNTVARNSFSNYGGGSSTSEETLIGPGCEFDKDAYISYENSGSRRITVDGTTFRGGNIRYYNGQLTELLVKNSQFINSGIIGARIKQSRITAGSRFVTTDSTKTAIQLSLDSYNTTVDNSTFEGYNRVSDQAKVGTGVRQTTRRQPR
ncbi:hypothetical protein GCM10028803_23530 [Larkinella knui]|uniref:Right handed beta helix domain-containing protein n=1 Tax=Larkinella knui TaxID=2025310 RepID=A0A3P1CW31_9BACT|nr:right-handed parallel beta-helix repeat-containing protein [Larkinella knui]RRB17419.1 hypothetical protein EHT87_03805 [Larkinella knui]